MPVSISRRRFLVSCGIGASTVVISGSLQAAVDRQDPNRFALFSDTHIAGDRQKLSRGTNMSDNLAQVVQEALATGPLPSSVLVCGDCAFARGETADYKMLSELVAPLPKREVPIHFALGNHDNRERFLNVLRHDQSTSSPVVGKTISIVETPNVDWILLDSLDATNKTPGVLGEPQLQWLDATLAVRTQKPVFVMVHHNPDPKPNPSGLVETKQLLDLLSKHEQVKTLFFGHSHHWAVQRHERLHLVNLPAAAYVFAKGEPNGWVDCQVQPDGMQLGLHCIDTKHPHHGQKVQLSW